MEKELNLIFEGVHPLVKVLFTELADTKYSIEIELCNEQGKFKRSWTQEESFNCMDDERFLSLVKGSAFGFSTILQSIENVEPYLETFPFSAIIIESLLSNPSLSTVEDFSSVLDSNDTRIQLLTKDDLSKEALAIGVNLEALPKDIISSLLVLESYRMVYTTPSMTELSIAIGEVVKHQAIWPLLAEWIKEWAGAAEWSMNEAWEDGPLIEELLAYGTFIMMEREVNPNDKPIWWADLYIMVDICFDFTLDDLKRSAFLVG